MSFDPSNYLQNVTGQSGATTAATRFNDWLTQDLFGGVDPYQPGHYIVTPWDEPGRDYVPGGPLYGVDPRYVEALVSAFKGDISKDDLIKYANDPQLTAAYDSGGTSALTESFKDMGIATTEAGAARDTVMDQAIRAVFGMTPLQYDIHQKQLELENQFKSDHQRTYSMWESFFGAEPTQAQIMDVEAHGKDLQQWTDYVRAMPSHLQGINIGQYTDLRKSMDGESIKRFGYAANDSQIQEAFNGKLGSAAGIQYYYDQMFQAHNIQSSPLVLNSVWKSANDFSQAVWNQTPNPADVHAIWMAAGSPGEIQPQQAATDASAAPANPPAQSDQAPPQ